MHTMSDPSAQRDSGDHDSASEQLAAWLDALGDSVLAYARRRVENDQVAEDLVQETFVAALQNFEQFAGRSSPKTWLIAILRNKLIAYYRHRGRHRGMPLDQNATTGDFDQRGIWQVPVGPWPHRPDQVLEQREFWQAFDDCLSKLPAAAAEVFVLRVLDGMDSENICNALEISSSNLAVRLHRARMALRNCLEKNWFGGD
jgi:RNA polymerase sigma-70 factor (ECF subfamily)